MKSIIYMVLLCLIITASGFCQQVYRWVDEDGVVHYGNMPPAEDDTDPEIHFREYGSEKNGTSQTILPERNMTPERYDDGKTRIHLSVFRDFTPVNFQISTNWLPYRDKLTTVRPPGITNEPVYESPVQKYGYLRLGTRMPDIYHYVFDDVDAKHPLVYFDTNGNGDLTDDGGPLRNRGSGIFATTVKIPLRRLWRNYMNYGVFEIWFFTNDSHWKKNYSCHYSRTQLKGTVMIDGKSYTAYIGERGQNDADFTNDGICIDIDGNEKVDRKAECAPSGEGIFLNGKRFYFTIDWM